MPRYSYAIASGHNVALVSLTNIETLWLPYTMGIEVPVISNPVNPYPVKSRMGSGRIRGDGDIDHEWLVSSLPLAALDYLIDTLLVTSGNVVKSKAVTIYTRKHDRGAYARYNTYLTLPAPEEDYDLNQELVNDLHLRFTKLIPL